MDRLRAAFVAVLLVSLANGGATVVDFAGNLRTIDAADYVTNRIDADVTGADVEDRRLTLTVRISNPTGLDVRLGGAHVRIHNESEKRIAASAGRRVDDGGNTVPAGGSLDATYEIGLSPGQRAPVRDALESDAKVTITLGLYLHDTRFTVARTSDVAVEDG